MRNIKSYGMKAKGVKVWERGESDVGEVGKGREEWGPRKSPKRYRWGQQRCLFPWVWNHVALTISWAGGESGGKERAISFDSLLRFASHAHPSIYSLFNICHPYHTKHSCIHTKFKLCHYFLIIQGDPIPLWYCSVFFFFFLKCV